MNRSCSKITVQCFEFPRSKPIPNPMLPLAPKTAERSILPSNWAPSTACGTRIWTESATPRSARAHWSCLLGHLDVVPVGSGWKHEPFGAEIDGEYVYARGATDDKGPTMASFYAIRAIKECVPELQLSPSAGIWLQRGIWVRMCPPLCSGR